MTADQLAQVLRDMPSISDPAVLVGLATADDAAVYRLTDDLAVVLTVDFFTPIVDNPYDFGRIAVTNAVSDIYAMGARPVIGLNLAAFPSDTQPLELLQEILRGGSDQAAAAGVSIVGGHSIDDPEPKYGMVVMGLVDPSRMLTNSGARPGDRLILTKPLGTGIVSTAIKHDAAPEASVREAITLMTTLNAAASRLAVEIGCSAATDVTGFGLMGHLSEMARASGVGARVNAEAVPLIGGVLDLIRQDEVPGGTIANRAFVEDQRAVVWADDVPEDLRMALCDAQTAGGLLLSVAPDNAAELMEALRAAGVSSAAEIGQIVNDPDYRIRVER